MASTNATPVLAVRTSFNSKRGTISLQLSRAQYAKCLSHFNCKDQLALPSGEAYHQGSNWYEVHLNTDRFEASVAADRFYQAVMVALNLSSQIAESKARSAQTSLEIWTIQRRIGRRVVPVTHQQNHRGRVVSSANSHLVSATLNKSCAITGYISDLMDGVRFTVPSRTAASSSSLNALVSKFS